MEHSEDISKLAEALAIAQGQITGAVASSKNPFFKSDYADLTSIMSAIRLPLSQNGIAYIQSAGSDSQSWPIITTMLMHSSGQWVRDTLTIKPSKLDAQGIGSAITYARRYSLASMVGVPQIDDDGEASMGRSSPPFIKASYKEKKNYKEPSQKQPQPFKKQQGITSIEEAKKAFPDITQDMELKMDDLGAGSYAGLTMAESPGWQDKAIEIAKASGFKNLNPVDRCLALWAKELKAKRDQAFDSKLNESKEARAELRAK